MSQNYFSVGQRLTNYVNVDVIVERVGRGGFGEVAMGSNQANSDLWLALKRLRLDRLLATGATGADRQRLEASFLRKALIWKGLWPHPNLLTAHFATRIDSQMMPVLDYAEKGSLRQRFEEMSQRGAWWTIASALELAQRIATVLVALPTPAPDLMCDQPIVHRDLKPENILLDLNEDAMITDLCLAKALTDAIAPDDPAARQSEHVAPRFQLQAWRSVPRPSGFFAIQRARVRLRSCQSRRQRTVTVPCCSGSRYAILSLPRYRFRGTPLFHLQLGDVTKRGASSEYLASRCADIREISVGVAVIQGGW